MPYKIAPSFPAPRPLLTRALALVLFATISGQAGAQQAGFKLLHAEQIRAALSHKYVTDDAH